MSKKLRPLGDVLLDMEELMGEMVDGHELQWGDILGLTHSYLMIHYPEAQEDYVEGGNPIFYYGPEED